MEGQDSAAHSIIFRFVDMYCNPFQIDRTGRGYSLYCLLLGRMRGANSGEIQ